MTVAISRALLDHIMALAAASRDEVCGLLLGREGVIEAIVPAVNVAPDPSRHFELDPATLIAAYRAARAGGPAVIGHYHSHPSGVAAPSATDAACAAPDGRLWLIVGGGDATLWRAGPGTAVNAHFTKMLLDSV
ncbi:M67 family metallopeptidase [Sphingobium sp. HBC34]|uniref:M67 family metallopeptidase n=1 Tax=Sphingobium cyanobacteriorum TaxID=3063954 RepID=A0ABT8ZNT0_9SPHN|nr:M67 family metallopeptidase [Sphingobium sp. HBC34]MDO7836194.1 M67 family metallopeptidase [Sphingobium sp. HBC34]